MDKLSKLSREYMAPKSVCTCSHTGDGVNSDHKDTMQPGHGACKEATCSCMRFTWARHTDVFAQALKNAKE